jgi:glycosyltransferase involved in cell wall biosynthesis
MRIAHITPAFYPAYHYGGPAQSVYDLCRHLARQECAVRVLTTDSDGRHRRLDFDTAREMEIATGVLVRYCRRVTSESFAPDLLPHLYRRVKWADVVHLTAVYSFPTIPTLAFCRLMDKPVVWSPRGALQRWQGSTRVGLKAVWERICGAVEPRKMALHVTSSVEATDSLKRLPGRRIVVIPNGVEIPEDVVRTHGSDHLRLLYLGRLHPIKGIESLLEACRRLSTAAGAWSLRIAGDGDPAYTQKLALRVEELGLTGQVRMLGQVVGRAKDDLFAESDVLVVPSFTENFGMVVAEALARSVPVIASTGTPWKSLDEIGCGLWVNNDPQTLAEAIARIRQMPLEMMGRRGRCWMMREFSWSAAAAKMRALYERVSTEAAEPEAANMFAAGIDAQG